MNFGGTHSVHSTVANKKIYKGRGKKLTIISTGMINHLGIIHLI